MISRFTNIKKEIAGLPKPSQEIARALLEKAEFMDAKLTDLQKSMAEKPLIENYNNGGGQMGTKESSEIKIYNATIKNYTTVMKQLYAIVGSEQEEKKADKLIEFMQR